MKLNIQKYLECNSLKKLQEDYGITTSAFNGDTFFSLNYSQIESKPSEITNQCRGLILATKNSLVKEQIFGYNPIGETIVFARGFDRFFNYDDSNAVSIDFEDEETRVFIKLDGSLILLYYNFHLNSWQTATRSVPLANKPITGWDNWTFRTLFEKALQDTLFASGMIQQNVNKSLVFDIWTSNLNKENTYCFELTTPLNRIVVKYDDYRIHLLGIRNNSFGKEYSNNNPIFGIPFCPSFKTNNVDELIKIINNESPTKIEGVVVCDKNFRRVKLKSLAYVAYNKVRDQAASSPRAVMQLILDEKLDDVLPILENYIQEQAIKMQNGLRALIKKTDQDYLSLCPDFKTRKEFAIAIQEKKLWLAPLMDRYSGKCNSMLEFIQKKRDPGTGEFPANFLETLVEMSGKE